MFSFPHKALIFRKQCEMIVYNSTSHFSGVLKSLINTSLILSSDLKLYIYVITVGLVRPVRS